MVLCVGHSTVQSKNVMDAEIQGLWEGVEATCRNFPNTRLSVECDSLIVVNAIQ